MPATRRFDPATRAGVFAAAVAVPNAVGQAERTARFHHAVTVLTRYSAARFVHGAVWTLPLSALVVARPGKVGPKLGILLIAGAVYVLWAGPGRGLVRFAIGHVVPTVLSLAVILTAVALSFHDGHRLYHTTDTGISAGLAALAGALVVLMWQRWSRAGAVVVGLALVVYFSAGVATEPLMGRLADVEHLLALAVGALLELRWPIPPPLDAVAIATDTTP